MIPIKDDRPTLHPPVLTILFIALNVLAFLWQSSGTVIQQSGRLFRFASVPYNVTHSSGEAVMLIDGVVGEHRCGVAEDPDALADLDPRVEVVRQSIAPWLTLFTSMFMHGGWMHLIGNMVFLWIFGNNVEDAMGRPRFLIFYLLCGLAASAAHIGFESGSPIPCVGASGAISGVLGGYLLLYPSARILTLIPLGFYTQLVSIPALVFLPFWFLQQVFGVLAGAAGGVAWWAHIGGFVLGLALIKVFESREHRERAPIAAGGFRHRRVAPRGYRRPWDP